MQNQTQNQIKNINDQRFQDRYAGLNDMQKKAVDNVDGPMLVVAGPGSGKTELLSLRTANILKVSQVSPNNILLLTFTDSGAHNMRERLVGLIGEAGYKVAVYTFHSFASDIMGRYAEHFFDGANFKPSTDIERINILENILNAMPRNTKLSSKHPEMGYTYQSDIMSCISGFKKGNIDANEWREKINTLKDNCDEVNSVISEKLLEIKGKSKKDVLLPAYAFIYDELTSVVEKYKTQEIKNTIAEYLLSVLTLELKQSAETDKTNNLTAFKEEYFTFDKNTENYILKDSRPEKIEKWLEAADVYEKYIIEMNKQGLYDFDDMIFKVGRELAVNDTLRNELEEKYQYIMIDEFQDTNDAQFALVKNLTSNPVNEGRPNVMAVGDDDQAIFKFQGAELDNINKFINSFTGVELITLGKNYRSTQNILDHARNVITKIEDRLEVRYPGQINKKIIASNKKLLEKEEGKIIEESFENKFSEMDYICREIKDILNNGTSASEISVISRSHANLKEMVEMMNEYKIPFSYEKKENVFEKQPIKELINIVYFTSSAFDGLRDDLLPEIMSYKFWGLDRLEVWKIAEIVKAGETSVDEDGARIYKKLSWLTVMSQSENQDIKNIAKFLIDLATDAKEMPLTHLMDKIIGTSEWQIEDVENIEDEENENKISGKMAKRNAEHFASPFRNHYFGQHNFDHNKPEYLEFLFALRTFMGALRDYKNGEILYAKDLQDFISIYNNNENLTLTLTSPFATSHEAIVLQTAHKSKGLEYEYVFIINSDENEWNGRKRTNKIGMPINLKLLPSMDELGDRTRLYYVAMTRAKHTLYITHNNEKFSALFSEEQNEINKAKKLEEKKNRKEKGETVNNLSKELVRTLEIKPSQILLQDEKVLLKRLLENYKMPVTHLINYLNIGKVGPEKFIEQNLLRFPQAMSPSSVYGSAMHEAMQNYYLYFKKYQKLASDAKLIEYFTNALSSGTLTKIDYDKYLESGIKNLNIYIKDLKARGLKDTDMVEVNFANEGVHIGEAHASGKIDKMSFDGDMIKVTDLKTGKSFESWDDGSSPYDKIKMHFFKYQLAYYYLLIKNSRTYQNYKVDYGYIEFLEADTYSKGINILELKLDDELISRVEKLTNIVYQKVMNLDFPDTAKYKLKNNKSEAEENDEEKSEITLKDILKFEEDLLNGEI